MKLNSTKSDLINITLTTPPLPLHPVGQFATRERSERSRSRMTAN